MQIRITVQRFSFHEHGIGQNRFFNMHVDKLLSACKELKIDCDTQTMVNRDFMGPCKITVSKKDFNRLKIFNPDILDSDFVEVKETLQGD